jgi:hypothetical protein
MARQISASLRKELEDQETGDAILVFITITHPDLDEAIRVVSDTVDYVWNSDTYIGFPFDIQLLTDNDSPPRASLTIQNVDRRIGNAIDSLTSPPRFRIDVMGASWFDQTVVPRVAIDSPEPEADYTADRLFLSDVTVTAFEVSATIVSWNYVQEVWPGIRATQSRLPGLYR